MRRWVLLIAVVALLGGCSTTSEQVGTGTQEKPEYRKTCGMDGYCAVWRLDDDQYVKCADKVPPSVKPSNVRCES